MRRLSVVLLLGLLLSGCLRVSTPESTEMIQISEPTPTSIKKPTMPNLDLSKIAKSAIIKTNIGSITVELYADKAPITVANFAALSDGSIEWVHPKTGQTQTDTPLYDGVIFHRVIKDFMIQTGDPLGVGTGGPGYKFQDEIDSSLTFEEPYMLAMANSGPSTNGSQFFITVVPTPWLTGKHTIFGKVVKGQDIVDKIATTQTGYNDKPVQPITIEKIEITY